MARWAQRHPKALCYRRLSIPGSGGHADPKGALPTHLRMISDAAFKKEDESGHSMRGAMYMRCAGNALGDMTGSRSGHLIDYVSCQQRQVTRATFTSELRGGCDTVDKIKVCCC